MNWFSLGAVGVGMSVVLVVVAAAERFGLPVFPNLLLALLALWATPWHRPLAALSRLWQLQMFRRAERGDADGAIRSLGKFARAFPGLFANDDEHALLEASLLSVAERHEDALERMSRIDPGRLRPGRVPLFRNNLAWTLNELGRGQEALPHIREAIGAFDPKSPPDWALGTLGATLQSCGEHDEAIAVLRRAIESGGSNRHLSIRWYYLGRALECKGDLSNARAAYEHARREDPLCSHAQLATRRWETLLGR